MDIVAYLLRREETGWLLRTAGQSSLVVKKYRTSDSGGMGFPQV